MSVHEILREAILKVRDECGVHVLSLATWHDDKKDGVLEVLDLYVDSDPRPPLDPRAR